MCRKKIIKYSALCIFIFLTAINDFAFAKDTALERPKLEDRLIALTFKGLAKAFIATADIEKLKETNIHKIKNMPEEKLQRKYAKVYDTLKTCPGLAATYGITQNLSREDIIKKLELLDKKQMYEIVGAVPDEFIAGQFKEYVSSKGQQIHKDLSGQIKQLWSRITEKAK